MIQSNSEAFSDRAFQVFLSVTLVLICASVVYPLYFVIVASFSDPDNVINGYVWLYPRKPNVQAYERCSRTRRSGAVTETPSHTPPWGCSFICC